MANSWKVTNWDYQLRLFLVSSKHFKRHRLEEKIFSVWDCSIWIEYDFRFSCSKRVRFTWYYFKLSRCFVHAQKADEPWFAIFVVVKFICVVNLNEVSYSLAPTINTVFDWTILWGQWNVMRVRNCASWVDTLNSVWSSQRRTRNLHVLRQINCYDCCCRCFDNLNAWHRCAFNKSP